MKDAKEVETHDSVTGEMRLRRGRYLELALGFLLDCHDDAIHQHRSLRRGEWVWLWMCWTKSCRTSRRRCAAGDWIMILEVRRKVEMSLRLETTNMAYRFFQLTTQWILKNWRSQVGAALMTASSKKVYYVFEYPNSCFCRTVQDIAKFLTFLDSRHWMMPVIL